MLDEGVHQRAGRLGAYGRLVGQLPGYSPGDGLTTLRLKNGSAIYGFGAETPDNLRGFAFDKGWLDEYAAGRRRPVQSVYDMLWFCLREAPSPQVVISTTPKPLPHVKRLVERGRRPTPPWC